MRLSAVVVTWNSEATIGRCLAALRGAEANSHVDLEIVVVDNASRDTSRLCASAADLLIANRINTGFAIASNQGFAVTTGEWVLFANPDLEVAGGFLSALEIAARAADDSVAVLVPELRFSSDPDVVNSRGLTVDVLGIPAELDAGEDAGSTPTADQPFGASGGAACIRASALAEIGGFEPCFFAYLEDVELAWRLRRAGYSTLSVPRAVAYHRGSSTTGEASALKAYLVGRNRRLLFALHGPSGVFRRGLRDLTDLGHMLVQIAMIRRLAPAAGRFAAFRFRRYLRWRRQVAAVPIETIPLAPRASIRRTLARKLRTRRLFAA